MAQRATVTWQQITLGLLFWSALAIGLGVAVAVVFIGIRATFEPPLRLIVAVPAVLAVIVAYGKWVWVPLAKLNPRKR